MKRPSPAFFAIGDLLQTPALTPVATAEAGVLWRVFLAATKRRDWIMRTFQRRFFAGRLWRRSA